jgi:hypothetical protein
MRLLRNERGLYDDDFSAVCPRRCNPATPHDAPDKLVGKRIMFALKRISSNFLECSVGQHGYRVINRMNLSNRDAKHCNYQGRRAPASIHHLEIDRPCSSH